MHQRFLYFFVYLTKSYGLENLDVQTAAYIDNMDSKI